MPKWLKRIVSSEPALQMLRNVYPQKAAELLPLRAEEFHDFVWTRYFRQTLPANDREKILSTDFFTIENGWIDAHVGCRSDKTSERIDTRGWDFLVCQVPTPFMVSKPTEIVIRYHDSIPLYLPHTVNGYDLKRFYSGLRASIRNNAFFACTSMPVREELVRLFPETEETSEVISDIVSDQFYEHDVTVESIGEIIRPRKCPETAAPKQPGAERRRTTALGSYIVAVSTLEPRKNY